MKNNDFAKIIIFILLNSSVYTQEIKQIVNNPMPNHQFPEIQSIDFPEIQSIDFPEIQSIDSPPIQIQESDTNIRLSKANKIIEQTRDTASNIKIPVANTEKVERLMRRINEEVPIPKPQIPNKAKTIVGNSAFDGFNLGITADVGFISGATFTNVPSGFSLTIGTPYGFDLGPFDFSVSAIFGGYSGSYDSLADSGNIYIDGGFIDEFNPALFGIGGNITLAKIIFTEGHIGNLGSGTGIHGFTGLSLERIMKKRKLPFHNILIGSELFISSDISGGGNTSYWIGMALRAVYEF